MTQIAFIESNDSTVTGFLPKKEAREYKDCMDFLAELDLKRAMSDSDDLSHILEQATKALENMERLAVVIEFLGAVELGRTSETDQDIMDSFGDFEAKLGQFNAFRKTVEAVRNHIIRLMSRPNRPLHLA